MTIAVRDRRPRRPVRRAAGAAARPGSLRAFNDAGVLTAADVHVADRLAELGGEPDEAVRLAVALAVRGVRSGSVCVDLEQLRSQLVAGRSGAALAAARRTGCRPCGQPAGRGRQTAAVRIRAAVPGPVPPAGGAGPAGSAGPRGAAAAGRRRRRAGRRTPPAVPRQGRRAAAARRRGRRHRVDHRAGRRPGHRQDHHRRPGAGAAAGPAGPTAAGGAGRADRQGRGPAAGRRAGRGDARSRRRPARPADADRVDPAPAAGLGTRRRHQVPAQPGQPAAVRRGGRRRDVDGVADHDGQAAGGGPARTPG